MKKIIEIDVFEEKDLLENYNRKKVSKKLIDYIIDETPEFNKNNDIYLTTHPFNLKNLLFLIENLLVYNDKHLDHHKNYLLYHF